MKILLKKLLNKNKRRFSNIHQTDSQTITKMYEEYAPVFSLTTGRTATKFMSLLFKESSITASYHEPFPNLQYFCNYAHHNQKKHEVLLKMIDAARMELILNSYIDSKIYIELNQCLTYFAYQLKDLFKKAKFVHIIRHPGDFVRSAVRKGWHKNNSIWEEGRVKSNDEEMWRGMDQIERLAWVWSTTNQYIEDFKVSMGEDRCYTLKIEDLFSDVNAVNKLFDFVGIARLKENRVKRLQDKKINELSIGPAEPRSMKKIKVFPKYENWEEREKQKVKKYTMNLAEKYFYHI